MNWKIATLISKSPVSTDIYSLVFTVSDWREPLPGQHYDIRLTSEDGYQAQRSYSIASIPGQVNLIEFGIKLLDDGEVSPYLINRLEIGQQIEIKGPLGGHFIWDINMPGPLLLIAGGSGVVPFMSMLRHYKDKLGSVPSRPVVLLLSAKDVEHIPYRQELRDLSAATTSLRIEFTLTKMVPPGWPGFDRRVDKDMLREIFGEYLDRMPMVFICGGNSFVESAANYMVDLGFQSHFIKTERFGG